MEKFDIFESLISYYGSAYLVIDRSRGTCQGIPDKYFKDNQVVLIFNPLTQPPWEYEDDFLLCSLVFEGTRYNVSVAESSLSATYSLHEGQVQAQAFFPENLDELLGKQDEHSRKKTPEDSSEGKSPRITKLF